MYRSAIFQVAAEAHGKVAKSSLFAVDGQKVCQRLGGMAVTAVARVDDGNACIGRRHIGCALLGVTHGDNIGVAADNLGGIGNALALGCRRGGCLGKADDASAQLQHRRLKAETRASGRLKEQRCQLFAAASLAVLFGRCNNILGNRDQLLDLGGGQILYIDQMSHV